MSPRRKMLGVPAAVSVAVRCKKCGKRYVNIEAHTGKCTGPKP